METDGKLTIPSPERTVAFTDNPVTSIAPNVSENDTTLPTLSQLAPSCTATAAGDNAPDIPDKNNLQQILGCFKNDMISMIQQAHDNQPIDPPNQQNDHHSGTHISHSPMSHVPRLHSPISHVQRSHLPMSHVPRLHSPISHAQRSHPSMLHAPRSPSPMSHVQRSHPPMSHAPRSPPSMSHVQRSHPPMSHAPRSPSHVPRIYPESHAPRSPTRMSQAMGPHPLMSHIITSNPQPSHERRLPPHIPQMMASYPSRSYTPGTQPSMPYVPRTHPSMPYTLGPHPPIPQTLESELPMPPQSVSHPCMPISHPTIHQSRPQMLPFNQSSRVNRTFENQDYGNNYTDDEAIYSQTDTHYATPRRNQVQRMIPSKLPPYTGRETWEVWYNRFQEVALISHWSDQEKLAELLPRLQGAPGEFVYGQLTHENRINYNTLITELNNRFRVVETCKTFASKFSNRHQGPNETVEEYAAELKRLYAKAHAHRNYDTRKEDLLRRFLDGLNDEQARFQVEYIKDPVDIDHAVNDVVHFRETRSRTSPRNSYGEQRHKKSVRAIHDPYQEDSSTDSDSDAMERISRVPTRNSKAKNVIKHPAVDKADTVPTSKPTTDKSATSSLSVSNDNSTMKEMVDLLREIKQGITMMQDGHSKSYTPRRFDKPSTGSGRQGQNTGPPRNNKPSSDYSCFRCGDKSHFIRNCPFPMVTGQMKLAMEAPAMFNQHENKASPRSTRQQGSASENMNLN